MTNRARKTTALLLTLIMLFTSLPLDVFAGTTASPWYDFVTGKELTEAVTKENYDAKAVKLYVGEEGYYSEDLHYCSNYQAVWFSGRLYHASNEGHAILSPYSSDEPGSTLAKDNYLYVQVINPRVEPTIENCKITATGNQGRDIYVTANANDANTSVSADVITKNGKNDLWYGLSWSSSNSSVVSVNPSGSTVDFIAPGSATLTVTGKINGANNVETTLEGHIYVTVESPKLESIVLNHTDTITKGSVEQAMEANRTRLCSFCAKKDDIEGIRTDDKNVSDEDIEKDTPEDTDAGTVDTNESTDTAA